MRILWEWVNPLKSMAASIIPGIPTPNKIGRRQERSMLMVSWCLLNTLDYRLLILDSRLLSTSLNSSSSEISSQSTGMD